MHKARKKRRENGTAPSGKASQASEKNVGCQGRSLEEDNSESTRVVSFPMKEEPIEAIEFNIPTNAVPDNLEFSLDENLTKDEPLVATEGGESLSISDNLQLQDASDSTSFLDVSQFSCALCAFSTTNSTNLKYHVRVHAGVKPFSCPECDFRTTSSSNLTKHLRVHTGQKPYACELCGHRSAQKDHLKRHIMRIHTGEKPFRCAMCKHRTSDSYSLKMHILRVHGKQL